MSVFEGLRLLAVMAVRVLVLAVKAFIGFLGSVVEIIRK